MSTTTRNNDETRLANEIVSVLDPAALRACSDDRDAIRYAVRSAALKLRTIVLRRAALRRLLGDSARDVKVEYLQRDLLRSATQRADYFYPRPSVGHRESVSEPEALAI